MTSRSSRRSGHPCLHSRWRCDECGQVLDLEEPPDYENPLIVATGVVIENDLSRRMQAFTHSRLVGTHLLLGAIGPAREEYLRCGESLNSIGRPR